jgi:hypothetical protein
MPDMKENCIWIIWIYTGKISIRSPVISKEGVLILFDFLIFDV